ACIIAARDGKTADHGTHRGTLYEGSDNRPDKESPVPKAPGAPVAELEGDAAENQAEQHKQRRDVERWQEYGISLRESSEERRRDHDQPSLIAVPERRDRRNH